MNDLNLIAKGSLDEKEFKLEPVLVEDELRDIGIDPSRYQGEFVDGKKNGYGIYNFAHGTMYDGEWSSDKLNGRGMWI